MELSDLELSNRDFYHAFKKCYTTTTLWTCQTCQYSNVGQMLDGCDMCGCCNFGLESKVSRKRARDSSSPDEAGRAKQPKLNKSQKTHGVDSILSTLPFKVREQAVLPVDTAAVQAGRTKLQAQSPRCLRCMRRPHTHQCGVCQGNPNPKP